MPSIDISGVTHAYDFLPAQTQTDAPVLVLIHGWLLSRQYWQPLVQKLSLNYSCLCYDLRGFGDSQASSSQKNEYSLLSYADDIKTLLEELEIQKAWLVGHSLGGSIALWAAHCCEEQVEGVICLNAGGGVYLKEEFDRFRQAGQKLIKYRPQWLPYIPLIDVLFTRAMVAKPLARHWGRQRVMDFVKADAIAAVGSLLESTTEEEVHRLPQLVSQLKQPVYFVAGEKDLIMEPKYVGHLASFHHLFQCQGNNVVEIPNCGHMSMIEQPEQVTLILEEILSNCDQQLVDGTIN
ncbi:alpha/beta hydrolase fold protein [Halothece sp. PCC 7418]|uniref:alpha/beta fold hydrolase n=1 Tax=Halothece sp. (strain PCC 7418) TaxID=65093 RepID=UPI0002A06954|nr:alpha/beta hydrolase [Halothece sp. PCC 7418]AFZ45962.1 alpha/beta hydrolase fold protein [Halothece sp. PCC 7418]